MTTRDFTSPGAAEMARSKYGFEKDCKELIKTLTEFKVPENTLKFDIVF